MPQPLLTRRWSPRWQAAWLALLAILAAVCPVGAADSAAGEIGGASDPANASYRIGGEMVTLENGLAEKPAAPGSASKVTTRILNDPVSGDLDGDGDEDAVVWLLQQTGGTGSFFYVAAAFRGNGGYQGTTAVLVGDRIAPQTLSITHRLVSAQYLDRETGAPMALPPAKDAAMYLIASAEGLAPVARASHETPPMHGWLVIGHEVRTFTPCRTDDPLWLTGDHNVISTLVQQHREAHAGAVPYAPLFVTLVGRPTDVPATGFGADYAGAFAVMALVQAWPAGNCMSDRIVVEEPLPGSIADMPLIVKGRATGAWYFEGEIGLTLVDPDRNVIARGFATAKSEWMKMGFVPFEGRISLQRPAGTDRAVLIVSRNNPSEDRSLDEGLEIPLVLH